MLEKATELDPNYAAVYAFLSWNYFESWLFLWSPDPQTLERAFELAQKAVTLDDSSPLTHATLGHIYLWKKQYDQAITEEEKAITLGPNCALCYSELGNILNYAGRPQDAIGLHEKAMRLSPQEMANYSYRLGEAYRLLGRYEEAIAATKRSLARRPSHLVVTLSWLLYTVNQVGKKKPGLRWQKSYG
ncbi:MAG TPA: tetratricopeptide repeat protein [Candidatus Binatia bacterium]|nr:tetratricopeptide repeat protein [Candidatus Binatia bacterium]